MNKQSIQFDRRKAESDLQERGRWFTVWCSVPGVSEQANKDLLPLLAAIRPRGLCDWLSGLWAMSLPWVEKLERCIFRLYSRTAEGGGQKEVCRDFELRLGLAVHSSSGLQTEGQNNGFDKDSQTD